MTQILHILKYKIISFLKLNPIHNINDLMKTLGSTVVYSGFAIGTFLLSKSLIQYLLIRMELGLFLLHEFLSIILFIFFLSVNVGNIIVSYSTLYKSNEINFLFSKPVKPVKVFAIKFLDNFFYSSSTLMMVIIAAFLGYGIYFKISLITIFSIILFNFLPMIFSAGSIGIIILLLIMRLSSKINLKYIITGLILFYILVLIFFFKVSSPVHLVNEVLKYYPNVDQNFDKLIPHYLKVLPNKWLAASLYWINLGQAGKALPYFAYQILVSAGLFSIAVIMGRQWYYKTWLSHLDSGNKKRDNENEIINSNSFERESGFNSYTEVLIKKEVKLFFREPSQVIHLALLMVLIMIFIFSLRGLAVLSTSKAQFQTLIYLSIFIFNVLLISTLTLRFVFPIISLEGESFWKIKSSPLPIVKVINIRVLLYLIPIFSIAQILNYFSNRKISPELLVISGIIFAFITITLVFTNLGMGGIFANYKEKNPIRISSSQGAAISFLLSIVYMIFLTIILFRPFNDYFNILQNRFESHISLLYKPLFIIIIVSTIFSFIFYKLSLKSLKRDF